MYRRFSHLASVNDVLTEAIERGRRVTLLYRAFRRDAAFEKSISRAEGRLEDFSLGDEN